MFKETLKDPSKAWENENCDSEMFGYATENGAQKEGTVGGGLNPSSQQVLGQTSVCNVETSFVVT